MWKALAEALTEGLRFLILWESPEHKLNRQRDVTYQAIDRLTKERDALLVKIHQSDVDRIRLGVVALELRRMRDTLAALHSGL